MDLDRNTEARRFVHEAGFLATPVLMTASGQVLVEPTDEQLANLSVAA